MFLQIENSAKEVIESLTEKEKKDLKAGKTIKKGINEYYLDRNLTDKKTGLNIVENNKVWLVGYIWEDEKTYYRYN